MDGWLELVELYEYKVRDVVEGHTPSGGRRSLRALRAALLDTPLDPPLHRRFMAADRRHLAHLRGESGPGESPAPPAPDSASAPEGWTGPDRGSDLSAAWTELHLLAWQAQVRRTLAGLARAWQKEAELPTLRVLHAALENTERAAQGTAQRLAVPATGDPLLSLRDPEVRGRLLDGLSGGLLTEQGRSQLRDALSQVREEPFPSQEGQGAHEAQLRAAEQEPLAAHEQARLVRALRRDWPAGRDPRERPALRDAAGRLLTLFDDLLLGSPPLVPGRVPEGAVLYASEARLARAFPDPQANEVVVDLRGAASLHWRGHTISWQAVGEHWQVQSGERAGLLRGDLLPTERQATLELHGATLHAYRSGPLALFHLDVPSGRALEERAGLARLVATLLDPADDYAAMRLARGAALLIRGGTLDPADLGPDSTRRYEQASGEALLDFTRRGAETLLARLLLQPGTLPERERVAPEVHRAAQALNLPDALATRLWARLYRAASGGEPLSAPERLGRLSVPASGSFTSVFIGAEPLTVTLGGALEGRVLTLRTDYRGQLMAVMPGLPAASLEDLLVLRVPGGSVLLVREGTHLAVAVEADARDDAPPLVMDEPVALPGQTAGQLPAQPGTGLL